MRSILGLILLLLANHEATCFRPMSTVRPRHFGDTSTTRQSALFSTMAPPEKDSATTKNVAVTALEKLITRQKAELEESERLLRILNSTATSSEALAEAKRTLSTAASIVTGFDYGFVSRSEGATSDLKGGLSDLESYMNRGYGGPPGNVLKLGSQQFMRNLDAMRGEYRDEIDLPLTPQQEIYRNKLRQLTLNSTEIWGRELADGPIDAPLLIKIPYLLVCYMLDGVFESKYVPYRFFLLETVARMPYFSYITMLHLYETLGFWRRSADMKRVHFAEELNEYQHLLIMESLGGDQAWWVRFVAQHSAIVYYIVLCILWAISPTLSYRFSELLETHAVNTYGVFLDENEKLLRELPPSLAAVEYYSFESSDPFYAEFQTSALAQGGEIRRPGESMRSLYDVFQAIRADEGDHVGTMRACLDPLAAVRSPSLEKRVLTGAALLGAITFFLSSGQVADLVGIIDQVDVTADGVLAADAFAAGAAGVLNRISQEGEGDIVKVGTDLMETGALSSALDILRRFDMSSLGQMLNFFARLL